MTAALIDHLWQSTLFALGVGLLSLALKRNGARYRYGLWFAASVKFLVPFALLSGAGGWIVTRLHFLTQTPAGVRMVRRIVEPFTSGPVTPSLAPILDAAPGPAAFHPPVLPILLVLWVLGAVTVGGLWGLRWSRMRAVLRASSPLPGLAAPARSSASLLEPCVAGVLRPVLLVPTGIEAHLSAAELDAVLAHELCHLRRRDNLTAAIHMLVQTLVWFHPLVWWIGGRLIAERERACDEDVIEAGADAKVYAGGILKVCRFYLQSPLACAAGVSGSSLKRRMEMIVNGTPGAPLGARKTLLVSAAAVLAVAAPLAAGLIAAVPAAARTAILDKAGFRPPSPAQAVPSAASTANAPPSSASRPLVQTLEQSAQTLVAPGQALAEAAQVDAAEAPLRLAVLDAPQAPIAAAGPVTDAPPPSPSAGCGLPVLATFHMDPQSYVPVIDGSINGREVKIIVALSGGTALFRSAAKILDVHEETRERMVFTPGLPRDIGRGWVHDLELADMPRKALSSYDVHDDFRIAITDGGTGWPQNPSAMLGHQFWQLADNDLDLRAGTISLVRPTGCGREAKLPFNDGAYSQTKLLTNPIGVALEYRIVVAVDGVAMEALIDPSASATLMTRQGADKLGRGWPLPGAQPQGDLFTGGQGKIPWAKARFATFSVGEETIRNPRLPVADVFNLDQELTNRWIYGASARPILHRRDGFNLPDIILGADFLRAHHLLISNSRRMVYFVYNGAPIFK